MKAGDAGFQVNAGGNTDLRGSVIASTQTAVDANKNTFTTGGTLSITDLQNVASFKASGVSVGVSVGMLSPGSPLTPGGSAGFGSAGGNASSTSSAGISGIAGNTAVRTGDANTGLTRIFDADKVLREINAQVAITQAFSKEAPKAVATFSANQMADLKKDLAKETDPDKHAAIKAEMVRWDEGGRYRVLLHTLAGAFSGGASGALGAAASASAAPLMNQLQDGIASGLQTAGLSADVAKGIASSVAGLTAAGAGAAVGGAAGAATAFTVDVNNRQLHPTERQRIKELASLKAKETCKGSADCERSATLYWADMLQSAAEGRIDNDKAKQNTAYYNQIINAAGIVGSEASVTGASVNYFNDLKSAQQLLNADAGKPIFMANGQVQLGSDGKPQTYFGATEAQKADAYGNMFPGGSPNTTSAVIAGKAQRDQDRLVRLAALSGSAKPDTTLEEILFGVRLPVRGVGAVVQVEKAAALNVEKSLVGGANTAAKLDQTTIGGILSTGKGARPDPATYLSQDFINSHLKQFDGGVTKFSSSAPSGVVGPPGGTFVMPKSLADSLVKQAGGDVAKLERLLSLEPGTLGSNPVRIDVASPSGLRISSGNELGANKQWIPGGYTGGGIPEVTINPAQPGSYIVKPTF